MHSPRKHHNTIKCVYIYSYRYKKRIWWIGSLESVNFFTAWGYLFDTLTSAGTNRQIKIYQIYQIIRVTTKPN